MKTPIFLALMGLAAAVVSCQRPDDPDAFDPKATNTVSLHFDHRVGSEKLTFGTTYKTSLGEEFTVSMLNYFVSNVTLTNADGTVLAFPDQYFLLRHADPATLHVDLKNVPSGNYKSLSFVVGVDSAKSVSSADALKGTLDPGAWADPMYWSWNSGYIFWRFEGTSPVAPVGPDGKRTFSIHVGGFGGRAAPTPNNLRRVTLPLNGDGATVRTDIAPVAHLLVDINKVFDGVTKLSLTTTGHVASPAAGTPFANNIATAFVVDHVHNDKE